MSKLFLSKIQTPTDPNLSRAEPQPQQTSPNNNQRLVVAVISILLTAMIAMTAGSAVYFRQKSADKKAINNLEQKINSLEEQVSVMKKPKATSQPVSSSAPSLSPTPKTGITPNWKTYINNNYHYQFKYPAQWDLTENKDYITLYDGERDQSAGEINARMAIYPDNPTLYNGVDIHEPIGTRREIGHNIFEEKTADLLLDNHPAARYKIDVLPGSQTDAVPGILVKVKIDSLALYIRLYAPHETTFRSSVGDFNQILSTFKFSN